MATLLKFKSKIEGKNADVTIMSDRIEWSKQGLSGRILSTEMIPVKAVTSVTTKRSGLTVTTVSVIASANSIEFRVPHPEADKIKSILTSLILGDHPAQQPSPPMEPAFVSTPVPPPLRQGPAPLPPGTPADWHPDPTGRHEHRYWDGARWTEHVVTNNEQTTDQP